MLPYSHTKVVNRAVNKDQLVLNKTQSINQSINTDNENCLATYNI